MALALIAAAPAAKAEEWTDTDRAAWTAVYDLIGKLAASQPEHTMPTTYQPTGESAVAKYRGVGVDGHMVTDIAILKTDGVTPLPAADGVGVARKLAAWAKSVGQRTVSAPRARSLPS